MSKRPVDPDKITNELSGASAFFKPREPQPAPLPAAPSHEASPSVPTSTPDADRTPVRPVRVVKRQMIRHPFELYMDQLDRLREVAQTEREHGGAGSMSKMVRDAIDAFLDHLPPAGS